MSVYRVLAPGTGSGTVTDGETIRPLVHHSHHSPDGWAWGYAGSGPAQLALDILWDHLGHRPEPEVYQSFKERFIAPADGDAAFEVTGAEIDLWLASR